MSWYENFRLEHIDKVSSRIRQIFQVPLMKKSSSQEMFSKRLLPSGPFFGWNSYISSSATSSDDILKTFIKESLVRNNNADEEVTLSSDFTSKSERILRRLNDAEENIAILTSRVRDLEAIVSKQSCDNHCKSSS